MGVPVIGCDCAVCLSEDPRDRRTRSSIYVETPEMAWVVDTGADLRSQCLREKVGRVDAVVFTHSHTDHIMGFDDLRPFCFGMRAMPIYASPETMEDLQRVFAWAFSGQFRFPGYILPEPRLIEGPFQLGKTTVVPFPVVHGRAQVNGYLFLREGRKVATYVSDVKQVPDEALELIAGTEVLIIDGLRPKVHPTHLSISEAVEVAQRVGAGKTWLTHLCHEAGHIATEAGLPENVRVAYDGLRLEL